MQEREIVKRGGKPFSRGILKPKNYLDIIPEPKNFIMPPKCICAGKLEEIYDSYHTLNVRIE